MTGGLVVGYNAYCKKIANNTIEKLCAQVRNGNMALTWEAEGDQISEFERKNGISLPLAYKAFLLCTDGAEFFAPIGAKLYGIAHSPTLNYNDPDAMNERNLVIGKMSSGDIIAMDKLNMTISIINKRTGKPGDGETFNDFAEFLDSIIGEKESQRGG